MISEKYFEGTLLLIQKEIREERQDYEEKTSKIKRSLSL